MKIFQYLLNTIPRKTLIRWSLYLSPALDLFYRGKKYTDPINGKSYRKFLPYGYQTKRDNALSPGTLSLERHRLLWLYLKRETDFFTSPHRVLHIAPEQAFFRRFKQLKNPDYITADIESPIADVKADITDLPFDDNSFDFILCNHVLEHITDDRKAMNELYRVMKKNGTGIFQVPLDTGREQTYENPNITDPQERLKHFGQYDHVRIYGMDYFRRLEEAGFQVEALDYTATLTKDEIEKYALPEGELIPVCRKL